MKIPHFCESNISKCLELTRMLLWGMRYSNSFNLNFSIFNEIFTKRSFFLEFSCNFYIFIFMDVFNWIRHLITCNICSIKTVMIGHEYELRHIFFLYEDVQFSAVASVRTPVQKNSVKKLVPNDFFQILNYFCNYHMIYDKNGFMKFLRTTNTFWEKK